MPAEDLTPEEREHYRSHAKAWSFTDWLNTANPLAEPFLRLLAQVERMEEEVDSYERLTYMLMPCEHFECYRVDHGDESSKCALCEIAALTDANEQAERESASWRRAAERLEEEKGRAEQAATHLQ